MTSNLVILWRCIKWQYLNTPHKESGHDNLLVQKSLWKYIYHVIFFSYHFEFIFSINRKDWDFVIGLVMNGHFILYRFVVIYLYGSIIIHSVVNVYFISYRFVFMTISSFINNYLPVYLSYFKIPIFSVYGKYDFKMITEKYDMVYVFSQR
jgi:hypothetical protein